MGGRIKAPGAPGCDAGLRERNFGILQTVGVSEAVGQGESYFCFGRIKPKGECFASQRSL